MKKPKLNPTAMDFYTRHRADLIKSGHLTDKNHDAFILLARTFGELMDLELSEDKQSYIRYFALLKFYQLYARGFGMSTDKILQVDAVEERSGEFEY